MSTTFKFRIDEALLKSAGDKAREENQTLSDVIREFLGIYVYGESGAHAARRANAMPDGENAGLRPVNQSGPPRTKNHCEHSRDHVCYKCVQKPLR